MSRRVSEWSTEIQDVNPEEGDLIEFDRTTYSHWAIYHGSDQLVHFHPIDNTQKVDVMKLFEFVPGLVTKDSFSSVQEESRFRVNNQPNFQKEPKDHDAVLADISAILGKKGLYYCLNFFNCEHFATFIKFGQARSTQIEAIIKELSRTFQVPEIRRLQEHCNNCATEQWTENLRSQSPKHFLQEKLDFLNAKKGDPNLSEFTFKD